MRDLFAGRVAIRSSLLAVFVTLVVAPLAITPYLHDDIPNRNWATQSIPNTVSTAWELNQQWMTREGRFFPGGFAYGLTVFHVFDTRAAYMTLLLILNLALIGLVAYVIHRLTRSAFIAAASVLALGACLQARFGGLDTLQSFGGLMQFSLILTIAAGLAAAHILRTGRRAMVIPLVLVWAWAVTSYEVSLLMLPALVLLLWGCHGFRDRTRAAWAIGPLVIVAGAEVLISMVLRAGATGSNPSYTTDMGGMVIPTFLKQFSAALPSSQYLMGTPSMRDMVPLTMIMLLGIAVALPTFLLWRPALGQGTSVPRRVSLSLILSGAWAWALPAALAGISIRWQNDLQWGQGYIYSLYQYVGIALVVAGALGLIADRSATRGWRTAAIVVLALVCIGCTISVASNITFAGQFVSGPQGPG